MRNKAFNITKNPKYGGYQRGLASTIYKLFDKKTFDNGFKMENMSDRQLVEELHNSVIRNFQKRKEQSHFIDNI